MPRMLSCLLVLIAFLGSAVPLLAADEKGGQDPMHIRYDTALWSIVVFLGLFAILYFKAWGPILEGLKKREDSIRSSLEDAKQTRVAMEKLRADFQKDLADAHQQIPKLMEEARRDAEVMAGEMRAKAAAEIQTERERLRREVELAKDQAIKELWEQAAQLATIISAKAIGRSLSAEDHSRLLDESVQEMNRVESN